MSEIGLDSLTEKDLDLAQTQIRFNMDIVGIEYDTLDGAGPATTQRDLFRNDVEDEIRKKGKLPTLAVEIDETSIKSSAPAALPADDAARTIFTVKITVPIELAPAALIDRLNDRGDLLKSIKSRLLKDGVATGNLIVHQYPMKEFTPKSFSSTDQHKPVIVQDIDVKGIYYDELVKSSELKGSFALAVQEGIASTEEGTQASSISLDISKGGVTDGIPYIHVTAEIPIPEGLSADATMSMWKDGYSKIATSVNSNIKDIPNIAQVSRSTSGQVHEIEVAAGTLKLGALRTNYASQVTMEVSVFNLDHNGEAHAVTAADIMSNVKKSLAEQAGTDQEDVDLKIIPSGGDTEAQAMLKEPLRFKSTVSVSGRDVTGLSLTDWYSKLLPAGVTVQKYFQDNHPQASDHDDYRVLVGVPKVENAVETVEVDLVVHGVEYSDLSADKQVVLLKAFTDAVRDGVCLHPDAQGLLTDAKPRMHVTISDPEVQAAVNIRVRIPAPDDSSDLQDLMKHLDEHLDNKKLQEDLQKKLAAVPGVNLVTTWTPDAIYVALPGIMDDVSGDAVISSDKV